MLRYLRHFFSTLLLLLRCQRVVAPAPFWLGLTKIDKGSIIWLLPGGAAWHAGFLERASVDTAVKEGLLVDPLAPPVKREAKRAFPGFPIIYQTAEESEALINKLSKRDHYSNPTPTHLTPRQIEAMLDNPRTQVGMEEFNKECEAAFPPHLPKEE
jgi:hypothetical protein